MSRLGKIWTSPNTLLGILVGVLGMLAGARARRGENAVLFLSHPLMSLFPARAVTLGNCVLYRKDANPELEVARYDGKGLQRIGDHERAHTEQYERWGPLFLPVYLLLALMPGVHPLEAQADRWAERRRATVAEKTEPKRPVGRDPPRSSPR